MTDRTVLLKCAGEKGASGQKVTVLKTRQEKPLLTRGKHREKGCASVDSEPDKVVVENSYLYVNEKTELEIAKQKLKSKDPAEREQAQEQINTLSEKDISRDQKVIDACGNGKAGSAGCASARLEFIVIKGEYETGP